MPVPANPPATTTPAAFKSWAQDVVDAIADLVTAVGGVVDDTAYDATSWNANTDAPSKNAIRDLIESILDGVTFTGDVVVPTEAYGVGWNGSNEVPTKDALYDKIETLVSGLSGYTLVDEDSVVVTSGSITLNTTSIADLTATQITLNGAQAGDIVYYEPSMLVSSAATSKGFDAFTYPSGTRTNAFGPGLSASLSGAGGYQAWFHGTNSGGPELGRGGRARRVLVSGDIVSGDVVVGLATAGTNTTARTLYAVANNPLQVTAQLWRP